MRVLVDTHLLVWAALDSPRLSRAARGAIIEAQGSRWFSLASLWEAGIKTAPGRQDFGIEPTVLRSGLLGSGYAELPIDVRHCRAVVTLPRHHGDPFDRMLVAQARVEGLTLLTSDAALASYGSTVRIV